MLEFALLTILSFTPQESNVVKVEFSSISRGYQEIVVFTPDSVRGEKPEPGDRTKKTSFEQPIRKQDWKHITQLATSLPRTEFEKLQSPTNKRAFDGARHSTITITLDSGETYHHLFDDENPNEKLQPLMTCIAQLRKQAMP